MADEVDAARLQAAGDSLGDGAAEVAHGATRQPKAARVVSMAERVFSERMQTASSTQRGLAVCRWRACGSSSSLATQFAAAAGAVADRSEEVDHGQALPCKACAGCGAWASRVTGSRSRVGSAGFRPPFVGYLFKVEALQEARDLIQTDGVGVAPQAVCQLCRGKVRVADQDLDHQRGVEVGTGLSDAAVVGLAMPPGNFRVGGQVDLDAIAAIAPDALFLRPSSARATSGRRGTARAAVSAVPRESSRLRPLGQGG